MALTRNFRITVQERIKKDPEFALNLYQEGIDALLSGDLDSGKEILRTLINSTVGFIRLSNDTLINPKSLMRMFGSKGNPRADKLVLVLKYLKIYSKSRKKFVVIQHTTKR